MMGAQRGTNTVDGFAWFVYYAFLRNSKLMTSFHVSLLEQLDCS